MNSLGSSSKRRNHQPVKVYVRQRPFTDIEIDIKCPNIIQHMTNHELVIKSGLYERRYGFDKVFGEETSQKEVYDSIVCPLIDFIVSGYNCTVFAYGQTGTGKTYTMIGNKIGDPSAGLIPRAAAQLFDELDRMDPKVEYTVRVSFIEIYNEEVRDLLMNNSGVPLRIFDDTRGSVCLKGLKEVSVFSLKEVYEWLSLGLIERQTASTNMNRQSSRSHTIFTISVVTRQVTVDGDEIIKTGKLYLVDLAGSENIGRSGSTEIRAREAGNINKSLLTLGKVIKSLALKSPHVPYRDSKLTRILQDSLGGKTKTCMIATISAAANVWDETISTLDYAQVARNVSNCPQVNENRKHVSLLRDLKEEIARLRKDLAAARACEGFYVNQENYEQMCRTLEYQSGELTTQKNVNSELVSRTRELENVIATKDEMMEELTQQVETCKRQNILLKPEVAKQLLPASSTTKLKQLSSGRIAPPNSALVAAGASRPIRDPRLLRMQSSLTSNLESKSSNLSDTNNKVVSSSNNAKGFVRDSSRNDPRLLNNNNKNSNISGKNNDNNKNNSPSSSPQKVVQSKFQQNQKPSSGGSIKSRGGDKSLPGSPTKGKIGGGDKSPTKSPNRHKKKDDKKSVKDSITVSNKRDRSTTSISHKIETSPTAFKNVKGKNRNYIRRNRSPSFSPEPTSPHDVDLRPTGPPPEKQARINTVVTIKKDEKGKGNLWGESGDSYCIKSIRKEGNASSTAVAGGGGGSVKDVDLRQLPIAIGKKRLSTDSPERGSSKKSKNEMLDVLFGNEDTDLRTLAPVVPAQPERPPTPPPPIISSSSPVIEKPKVNLDVLRAKLANATGRDKIMAQSFRKKKPQEDEDLRLLPSSAPAASPKKIIISTDEEECIKAGKMTKEQEKQLMNKIIAQIEQQKLKEAQMKDKQTALIDPDCSLQPVSDDELEDVDDEPSPPKIKPKKERPKRDGFVGWRGGGKNRRWDEGVAPRPLVNPWINPWRPVNAPPPPNPNFPRRNSPELPPPNDNLVMDSFTQDDIKTMNIDGIPRDIRYYGETSVVFLSWDDPREISFQNGSRRVMFDDDVYLLNFNDNYKEVSIGGKMTQVRLGGPSREIFIEGRPYELFFGGPAIAVELWGKVTMVKLDGPLPQVKIGTEKRLDLVAGKVNLIIDAKIIVPVFLDAKPQRFIVDGETHTLQFVDALKTVLINDVPFSNVEFGGLPKPITVHDKKHFIRFSVLPRGVRPGFVRIKDMDGGSMGGPEHDTQWDDNSQDGFARAGGRRDDDSPHYGHNMQQTNLDLLSTVMTSSIIPPSSNNGYQVENFGPAPTADVTTTTTTASSAPVPPLLPPTPLQNININELFQKLVSTGIVATKETTESSNPVLNIPPLVKKPPPPTPKPPSKPPRRFFLNPVTFGRPETLKTRQNQLYDQLYSGMQCSSCGMRFPRDQTVHYSQHLDWHFRQNRKGKRNVRVAASRRWYYSLTDWKNYEEIEDLEEREKNYFDQQQLEGMGDDDDEDVEVPSVPADHYVQDAHCDVCKEKFDHFFNEEKEEWHLRNAIRVEGDRTYHPVCYEDYQTALLNDTTKTVDESTEDGTMKSEDIPGLEIILDDDDDEIDLTTKKEEVVIDESDESTGKVEDDDEFEDVKGGETFQKEEEEDDDDDVIIHEVIPERIVVDDDKEYLSPAPPPMDPVKIEQIEDDGFMDVEEGLISIKNGGGVVKIKSEPIDPDDVPLHSDEDAKKEEDKPPSVLDLEAEAPLPVIVVSSLGSKNEPIITTSGVTKSGPGRIKINISKPLPVVAPREIKEVHNCDNNSTVTCLIDPSQPLPPGEEPPVVLKLKPALRGVELKTMHTVNKGRELTGMCSIM